MMGTNLIARPFPPLAKQLTVLSLQLAVAAGWQPELLRLFGRQPLETLGRLLTPAVKELPPGEGRLALFLHAKGQFRALMAVFAGEGDALLLVPPGRGGEVISLLGRSVALGRCALTPVPTAATVTLLGPGWEAVAAARGVAVERVRAGGWSTVGEGEEREDWFGWTFLGVPGAVLRAAGPAASARWAELWREGAIPVGEEALKLARILAAWPAWGAELTAFTLPPELPVLERLAISYRKGCYPGQETIARL